MSQIERISEEAAAEISSHSSVRSTAQIIRSLVINSVEARCSKIEINISQNGEDITVVDDGDGFEPGYLEHFIDGDVRSKTNAAHGHSLLLLSQLCKLEIRSRHRKHFRAFKKVFVDGKSFLFSESDVPLLDGTEIIMTGLFSTPTCHIRSKTRLGASNLDIKKEIWKIHLKYTYLYISISRVVDGESKVELILVPRDTIEASFFQICDSTLSNMMKEVSFKFQNYSVTGFLSPPTILCSHLLNIFQFIKVKDEIYNDETEWHTLLNKSYKNCFHFAEKKVRKKSDVGSGLYVEKYPLCLLKVSKIYERNFKMDHQTRVDKLYPKKILAMSLISFFKDFSYCVPGNVFRLLNSIKNEQEEPSPQLKIRSYLGEDISNTVELNQINFHERVEFCESIDRQTRHKSTSHHDENFSLHLENITINPSSTEMLSLKSVGKNHFADQCWDLDWNFNKTIDNNEMDMLPSSIQFVPTIASLLLCKESGEQALASTFQVKIKRPSTPSINFETEHNYCVQFIDTWWQDNKYPLQVAELNSQVHKVSSAENSEGYNRISNNTITHMSGIETWSGDSLHQISSLSLNYQMYKGKSNRSRPADDFQNSDSSRSSNISCLSAFHDQTKDISEKEKFDNCYDSNQPYPKCGASDTIIEKCIKSVNTEKRFQLEIDSMESENSSILSFDIDTDDEDAPWTLPILKGIEQYFLQSKDISNFQVIGQLDKKFIVIVKESVILLADQHAVHERIRLEDYEKMLYSEMAGKFYAPQFYNRFAVSEKRVIKMKRLTPPLVLTISTSYIDYLHQYSDILESWFIKYTVSMNVEPELIITCIPLICDVKLSAEDIYELIRYFSSFGTSLDPLSSVIPPLIHHIIKNKACHGAVKFGEDLNSTECKMLMEMLKNCELPFQCAHGRPSIISILDFHHAETFDR